MMMKTLESSAQSTIDDQFYLISRAFRGARLMLGNIIQSLPIIAEDDNPSRTLACIGSPPYDVPFFFSFLFFSLGLLFTPRLLSFGGTGDDASWRTLPGAGIDPKIRA